MVPKGGVKNKTPTKPLEDSSMTYMKVKTYFFGCPCC